jgi:AsmA-like protein
MVRAEDVSARIRFSSLVRGRLEIASLSATEPSINLVRDGDGRWNLASLLERSERIPTAPTAKLRSERRPAFPYLEATHARINFKLGQEKKPYALTDADVALWQDSENSWGARLMAQPVRTDFNLTDTGLLRVNAAWQRASRLGESPVQATLQWERGQLGQITKLFSGRDRGWRGGVSLAASLSGTPESLLIRSRTTVEDFRRYDIVGGETVRLATECSARFSAAESALQDLTCESPVSGGAVRLRGTVAPLTASPGYDLTLAADEVPLLPVLRLLRVAKKKLPADLAATGRLDAEFHAQRNSASPLLVSGQGSISDASVTANRGKDEITFAAIPFVLVGARTGPAQSERAARRRNDHEPDEPHLRVGSVSLAMGGAVPAAAEGWVTASGYHFSLRGDTTLKSVFRLARILGVPELAPAAEGWARLDVSLAGPWQGFAAPVVLGTAHLRNVRAEARWLNTPIEIASATITLAPDALTLERLSAQTGNTHWDGSVTSPRHCAAPGCVFHFDLGADRLSTDTLVEWFTPHPAKRPWYRLLAASDAGGKAPLLEIQARGTMRVNQLMLKTIAAGQVAAQARLDHGKITLNDLRGQLFQGTYQGTWFIDISSAPARFQATGTLGSISLAPVTALMNDVWATGMADGKFDVEGAGDTFLDFLAHADGRLQFVMRNGTLTHVEIPGVPKPLPVHRFVGDLRLNEGTWKLEAGRLESRDGIYQLSGTAAQGGGLDLVLTRRDQQTWNVTGTLARPRVVSRTEGNRAQADAKSVKP